MPYGAGRRGVHGRAGRSARRPRRRVAGRLRQRRAPRCRTAGCATRSRRRPGRARVHPVFFGSAITGAGVDVTDHRPASRNCCRRPKGPTATARFPAPCSRSSAGRPGEKIAYVRMFSGTVRVRDRLPFDRAGRARHRPATRSPRSASSTTARPSGARRSRPGRSACSGALPTSGSVTRIGACRGPARCAAITFAPPTLETVVVAGPAAPTGVRCTSRSTQLAEQDPLINLRQDELRQEMLGLALRRGAEGGHPGDAGRRLRRRGHASARRTTHLHRTAGRRGYGGGAHRRYDANPFLATVGLRIEPAPVGSGRASSGWPSSSGRCRSPSSRRSRTPCAARCARGSTAGRSPTAWSP